MMWQTVAFVILCLQSHIYFVPFWLLAFISVYDHKDNTIWGKMGIDQGRMNDFEADQKHCQWFTLSNYLLLYTIYTQ